MAINSDSYEWESFRRNTHQEKSQNFSVEINFHRMVLNNSSTFSTTSEVKSARKIYVIETNRYQKFFYFHVFLLFIICSCFAVVMRKFIPSFYCTNLEREHYIVTRFLWLLHVPIFFIHYETCFASKHKKCLRKKMSLYRSVPALR